MENYLRNPLEKSAQGWSASGRILVIPVPIHANRLRTRGFNQAELLAREICALDGEQSFELCTDFLKKVKDTASQVSKNSRSARLANLKDAFQIHLSVGHPSLQNRTIFLIDDVTTTGATLEECQKPLKSGGAGAIFCLTLAG